MASNKQRLLQVGLEELRHKARTDLYFLAKDILDYDLVEAVHKPVCDHFVHKDPARPFDQQDTIKQRLLLDPRGHFKTTLDIADIVQWVLCFPNVRILVMTGTLQLAQRMIQECKAHFQYNGKLRHLFPEYCPQDRGKDDFGTTAEFTSPARTDWRLREPTVSISTIDSIKAGSHYDIIKCDDLVNELNVNTREQLEATIRAFHYTTPILEPYGYRDVIGTRYAFDDLYGTILDGDTAGWKVHIRPAWMAHTPKGGATTYEVLFPERFPLAKLQSFQHEDAYLFNCQYLNRPIPGETQQFPPDLILTHTIPWTQVPKDLRIFIMWDLGFSQKQYADWSVGAVGGFDGKGRIYILNLIRGRYMPHELVNAILTATHRYKPLTHGIEEAGGSRLLEPALYMRAHDLRMHVPVEWIKVSPKKTKVERISALQALFKQDKLFISAGCDNQTDLMNEFTRFPKYSHDDIPDAIALLTEHFSNRVDMEWPDDRVEVASYHGGNPALGGLTG